MGANQTLPWEYKEDLRHFYKCTTKGRRNAVIMGRKTYMSLPKTSLPGRTMLVLSRTLSKANSPSTQIFLSWKNLQTFLTKQDYDHVCVIGGRQIYRYYLEYERENIACIYWTRIRKNVQGDVIFPHENLADFYPFSRRVSKDHDEVEFYELRRRKTLNADVIYQRLLRQILAEGECLSSRSHVQTLSMFGTSMRFSLEEGFPLLTTKKMYFDGVVKELLWFLSGSTNGKVLEEQGVRIWKGNTSRAALDKLGFSHRQEGDGGPIYGFLMRHYGANYVDCTTDYRGKGVDQIERVLHQLKTTPESRRIVMNLWDPTKIEEMVLPPCHVLYQFQVRQGKLHCVLYQRSGDVGLGVPFNIASASLLTIMFAKLANYGVGTLTHMLGDAHIYASHRSSLETQHGRLPYMAPLLEVMERGQKTMQDFKVEDFLLHHYDAHDKIPMEMIV